MKISVCGIPFEVVMREPDFSDDANCGRYEGKKGKIFIDKTMPKEIQDVTLVHEWMHGVYDQNGVEHEEQHVSVMAAELYRNGFRIKAEE